MLSATFTVDKSVKDYFTRAVDKAAIHAAFLRASSMFVTEAKRIITEKDHIITGNLRREQKVLSMDFLELKVGSEVPYAYYVELLPDGGFLREAVANKIDEVAAAFGQEMTMLGGSQGA